MHTDHIYNISRTKRLFDLCLALPALMFSLPFLTYGCFRQLMGHAIFTSVTLLGAGRQPYRSLTAKSDSIRHALRLWDVVCGRASVVGPRLLPLAELDADAIRIRSCVPPGLVSLHWLRWRSNIAFSPESLSDAEYASQANLRTDLSIVLRALLALIYGRSGRESDRDITVLGVHIDNVTMSEALRSVDSALDNCSAPTQIAFVNADCLNLAARDAAYRSALEGTSLVLADGIGIKIAGTLLGRPVRQNVNGTDMFPRLCDALNRRGGRLFLLGARPEVVASLAERIGREYPSMTLCGYHNGYFSDELAVVQTIAQAEPDVLLVALGAPHQENFIARNKHSLRAKVCIGVGGLFDFYSGRIPRAPQWVREAGLEWAYRLYQEPGRMWRRYLLGNAMFLMRVFGEKLGRSFDPATAVIR